MRSPCQLETSTFCKALVHNHSLATEPKSIQDTTKCATQILDAKDNKAGIQSIEKDNVRAFQGPPQS